MLLGMIQQVDATLLSKKFRQLRIIAVLVVSAQSSLRFVVACISLEFQQVAPYQNSMTCASLALWTTSRGMHTRETNATMVSRSPRLEACLADRLSKCTCHETTSLRDTHSFPGRDCQLNRLKRINLTVSSRNDKKVRYIRASLIKLPYPWRSC